jgi:HK97 family phage prohead protease
VLQDDVAAALGMGGGEAVSERREITVPVELYPEERSDGRLRLRGLAAVYDSPSEDIGFVEVIERGAFTEALRAEDDQVLLWQHDTRAPLARRSAGNLELTETARGLEFRAELPQTTLARDALELVRSGVVKAMSFAFSMEGGRDRWTKRDGKPWRYIERVGRLFEVSLVTSPAYAATSVQARALAELRAKARTAAAEYGTRGTRGPLRVRPVEAYGPDSPHSFFRDLVAVRLAEAAAHRARGAGLPVGADLHGLPAFGVQGAEADQGGLAEARARLATIERRDVTTGDPGAGAFVPATGTVPAFVAELFATAAHAEARLFAALPQFPLPAAGTDVTVPRIATGASVAVQAAENAPVSETDIDGAAQAARLAYIGGRQDVSRQALDRALPGLDVVLARELGRALGAAIDAQLVAGQNASGETLGLAAVTGIKALTYTDASPSAQELVAQTWKAYNEIASAGFGVLEPAAYAVVLHPRRLAFAYANGQASQAIAPAFPGRIVPSRGLRTTLGAGSNEDEVFVLLPAELPVYVEPPRVIVDEESLSATLQVRLVAVQALATGFGRAPAAICRVSGSGLTAPTL